MIKVENLWYQVNELNICKNINFQLKKNSLTGIVGPNGSGKSTLLKQIYRVINPTKGTIYLDGKELSSYKYKDSAKKMSVLSQENQTEFDFSVEEVVLMGRAAYHDFFQGEQEEDIEIMKQSLAKVGLSEKRHQIYSTLSGGEKQRVLLARALTQNAEILILDEPTNHLDIGYQFKVFELLQTLSLTVFAAIHDLNFALKYCDEVILLSEGEILAIGTPKEILTEEAIRRVFKVDARVVYDEVLKSDFIHYISSVIK